MPYKQFTPVTLTASDVNTYLMKQSVMVFATAAARATALPLPDEGMVTYISATDVIEFYDGTNWVRSGTPAGMVSSFAGSTAPTGWLLCFGQAVSRTTYADLFTSIGTTYGAGNGSTTFNLPDLRGRVPAGLDNMGGSAANRLTNAVLSASNTLGATGGAQTHTLTSPEMPVHTHIQNQHFHSNSLTGTTTFAGDGHTHAGQGSLHAAIGATNSDANRIGYIAGGIYANPSTYSIQGGALVINPTFNHNTPVYGSTGSNSSSASVGLSNAYVTATNQDAGGGGAHNNTQPAIVLNYIIKV